MTKESYYMLRNMIRQVDDTANAYFFCDDNTYGQKDEALSDFIFIMGAFVMQVEDVLDDERYIQNIDMDKPQEWDSPDEETEQ